MAAECSTDLDCPTTLLCYTNASFAGGQTICTCNHWYGFTGQDCLDLSTQTYVFVAIVCVVLAAATVLFAAAAVTVFRFVRHVGLHQPDSQFLTLVFATAGLVCVIVWRVTIMVILLDPAGHDVDLDSNNDKKYHSLVPLERGMIASSLLFTTLACLNVSLMWVKVAIDSAQMTHNASKRLIAYRKTVYTFEALYVIGMAVLFASGLQSLVLFYAAPFLIFIVITHAYGALRMSRLLRDVGSNTVSAAPGAGSFRTSPSASSTMSTYIALVERIRRTAVAVSVSILLGIIFAGTYSFMAVFGADGTRTYTTPDHAVHFVVIANETISVSVLLALAAVLAYVLTNVRNAVRVYRTPMTQAMSVTGLSNSKLGGSQFSL